MAIKLYVGNLAHSTTEAELRQLFAQAGHVTAIDLSHEKDGGQFNRHALVTLSTQAEAEQAIARFNTSMLSGRALKVTIAQPKTAPGGGYQSSLSAFSLAGQAPLKGRPTQPPAAAGGYQSRLSAFGAGQPPVEPRRRGRGQRR